jgi:predicted MFS family arabinose efflux permease
VAVSTLTGIGGGLYFGISANFVLQTVDNRAANTAISVQAVINGAAGIAGTALGGIIIDAHGVTALTTGVGVLTLVTTAIFAGGILLGRKVLKIPTR